MAMGLQSEVRFSKRGGGETFIIDDSGGDSDTLHELTIEGVPITRSGKAPPKLNSHDVEKISHENCGESERRR